MTNNSKKNNEKISIEKTDKDKLKTKKTYSKKKKIKKNILSGIAYVMSTFNNTIISIADLNGNVIAWSSAGSKGFKGSRKSTPYAAQIAADPDFEVITQQPEIAASRGILSFPGC